MSTADLGVVLREVAANITRGQGEAPVDVHPGTDRLMVAGDGTRIRRVIEALVFALRREIIDESTLVVSAASRANGGGRVGWITFGTPAVAAALQAGSAASLEPFDEWRGGCGLMLPLARQIVAMHGGRLLALSPAAAQALTAPPDQVTGWEPGESPRLKQTGGVLELPLTE